MDEGKIYARVEGYGDAACWMSMSHQIGEVRHEVCESEANIRHDIGDAECNVKEAIHAQSLANGAEFCGVNKNISDNAHRNVIEILANRERIKDAQCAIEKSVLENRYILGEKIDRETDLLKLQLNNFERQVAENFCTVRSEGKDNTQRILDRLTADKLDEKNNIIDELRHERRFKDVQFLVQGVSNEVNGLKQMFNSQQFEQRFSSKVNQFGAGNVALPVQTANQG